MQGRRCWYVCTVRKMNCHERPIQGPTHVVRAKFERMSIGNLHKRIKKRPAILFYSLWMLTPAFGVMATGLPGGVDREGPASWVIERQVCRAALLVPKFCNGIVGIHRSAFRRWN